MTHARPVWLWLLAACLGLGASPGAEAADPGIVYPPASDVAVRHGSVLIYNLVTSSGDPAAEDTRLTLTNRSATQQTVVRLFFVDGADGSATSSFTCLTPGQTSSVLASALRPGVTGFVVGIAVDVATGCPRVFNELGGQGQVRLASGFQGTLPALGVGALGPIPLCGAQGTVAFDGVVYNLLPRVLHLTNTASRADERTLLVVNRLGGDLSASSLAIGGLTGTLYDDEETAFGYTQDTGTSRQFRSELTDAFPVTAPPFGTAVPAGRSGWMRVMGVSDVGLTGVALFVRGVPQATPSAARTADPHKAPAPVGDLTGAVNLRISTLSGAANSYTFTVAVPTC